MVMSLNKKDILTSRDLANVFPRNAFRVHLRHSSEERGPSSNISRKFSILRVIGPNWFIRLPLEPLNKSPILTTQIGIESGEEAEVRRKRSSKYTFLIPVH